MVVLSRQSKRALALLLLRSRRRRGARYWVHLINLQRKQLGEFGRLCAELKLFPDRHHQYFRMSKEQFEQLHSLLEESLTKQDTNYRKSISSKERLAVTLRVLATGMSFRDAAFRFRLGESTVNSIVKATCSEIVDTLMPIYIPEISENKWSEISENFYKKWNIPNCLGALDGKHVSIFAPKHSGSQYFNYKGHFSIVLMALADADYKYIMIDAGSYGSNSDGGIFANSQFGKKWLTNSKTLHLPNDQPLPHTDEALPLVLVADEAFPLKENILRPYPGRNLSVRERVFNYRLSRARGVVENTFGITAHTWRILLKRIEVNVNLATLITVACCVLHNFLAIERQDSSKESSITARQNETLVNNNNKQPVASGTSAKYARPTKRAIDIRNVFADWFMSPAGEVPWQMEFINK